MLAIIESADREGGLDDLEDELFRFGRVVNAEPDLRVALSSPFAPRGRKQELVDALLRGKVTQPSMRLISSGGTASQGT